MFRKIAIALATVAALTGAAHAEASRADKAILLASVLAYDKLCTTPLPPVAVSWKDENVGTFTEKESQVAIKKLTNTVESIGLGPWCRMMTTAFKATIAE